MSGVYRRHEKFRFADSLVIPWHYSSQFLTIPLPPKRDGYSQKVREQYAGIRGVGEARKKWAKKLIEQKMD